MMSFNNKVDPAALNVKIFEQMRIGIVHANWHEEVVSPMLAAAKSTLLACHVLPENIVQKNVPGCFELPLGVQALSIKGVESIGGGEMDGVVCLGCAIRGETNHFEDLSREVMHAVLRVSYYFRKPIGYGVLTVDNKAQAMERATGIHGNKGEEAAFSVVHMLHAYPEVFYPILYHQLR